MERKLFSQKVLDCLKIAEKIADGKVPKLQAWKMKKGVVFYFVAKVAGKTRFIKIGDYGIISIIEARTKAAKMDLNIKQFGTPEASGNLIQGRITVEQVFSAYKIERAPRQATIKKMEQTLSSFFPRYLDSFSEKEIRQLHESMKESFAVGSVKHGGLYAANRVVAYLKIIFSYAIKHDMFSDKNPCLAVRMFRETPRRRYITPDEMPRLIAAIETVRKRSSKNWSGCDLIQLALLTGQRPENLMAMRADQIQAGWVWIIPGDQAKGGRDILVPLHQRAVDLLKRRGVVMPGEDTGASGFCASIPGGWVFPSGGASGHIVTVKHCWQSVVEVAGLENVRFYDLRRTAATWALLQGAAIETVAGMLGHADPKITAKVYAHVMPQSIAMANQRAVDAMFNDGNTKETVSENMPEKV